MKRLTKAILSVTTLAAFLGATASPLRADTVFYVPSDNGTNHSGPAVQLNGTYAQDFTSMVMANWGESAGTGTSGNQGQTEYPGSATGFPRGFFVQGTVPTNSTGVTNLRFHAGPIDSAFQSTAALWDSDLDTAYGFWLFGEDDGSGGHNTPYGLGVMEEGSDTFSDSRIWMQFQNTGSKIQGVKLSYVMQQWVEGKRLNELHLRYTSTLAGGDTAPDLVNTQAPVDTGNNSGALDGSQAENQVGEEINVIFPTALNTSDIGYFTWRYATSNSGNTSGHRDALALTSIEMEAIPAGVEQTYGSGNWIGGTWSPGPWSNGTAGSPVDGAIFGSGVSTNTVHLNGNVETTDVSFASAAKIDGDSSAHSLTVDGPIKLTTANTVTFQNLLALGAKFGLIVQGNGANGNSQLTVTSAPVTTIDGISLTGAKADFSGTTIVPSSGSNVGLIAVNDDAAGNHSVLTLPTGNLTTTGLQVSKGSSLAFASGSVNLTLDVPPSLTWSERADLAGSALTLVKKGQGTERFRTTTKSFTGTVDVQDGVLELTENTVASGKTLTNTTAMKVEGTPNTAGMGSPSNATQGELLLSNQNPGAISFQIGTDDHHIELAGGTLAVLSASGQNTTIVNPILVDATTQDSTITGNQTVPQLTLSGILSGTGTVTKKGSDLLLLTNTSNSFSGTFEVSNGTLQITNAGQWGGQAGLHMTNNDNHVRIADIQANITVNSLLGNTDQAPANLSQDGALDLNTTTFTVNQLPIIGTPGDGTTEDNTSFQGDIIGSGTFHKASAGWLRLTQNDKSFTGDVFVDGGVLTVSDGVPLAHVPLVTVGSGGQLRLNTGTNNATPVATISFAAGAKVLLASAGRQTTDGVTTSDTFGVDGALRYDPGTNDSGVVLQQATFSTPIQIGDTTAGKLNAADIHVNGQDKQLILSGTVTGSGTLTRTGGGKATFTGNGSAYSGSVTVTNGATTVGSSATLGNGSGTVTVGSASLAELGAESSGGTVHATVHVVSGGYLSSSEQYSQDPVTGQASPTGVFNSVGPLAITGTLTTDSGSILIPFNGSGTLSTVTITGTGAINGTIDVQGVTLLTGHTYVLVSSPGAGLTHTISGTPTLANAPVGATLTAVNSGTVHQLQLITP